MDTDMSDEMNARLRELAPLSQMAAKTQYATFGRIKSVTHNRADLSQRGCVILV